MAVISVRIPDDVKVKAEQSAALLDVTLSQVVRRALRQLIIDGDIEKARQDRAVKVGQQLGTIQAMAGSPVVPEVESSSDADPRRMLTRQQRRALERDMKKGRL